MDKPITKFVFNFVGVDYIQSDKTVLGIVFVVLGEAALFFVFFRVIKVRKELKAMK